MAERIDEIQELRQKGWTLTEIGERYRISRQRVWQLLNPDKDYTIKNKRKGEWKPGMYTHDLTQQQYAVMRKLLDGGELVRNGKSWLAGGEDFQHYVVIPLFGKNALKCEFDESGNRYEVTEYGRELTARFERGESPYGPAEVAAKG